MDTKITKPPVRNINKPAYIIFILAGTYFLIVKNYAQAASFWGIALIFDPFNPETAFQKRPFYQKAWLFIHLAITLGLFIVMALVR